MRICNLSSCDQPVQPSHVVICALGPLLWALALSIIPRGTSKPFGASIVVP